MDKFFSYMKQQKWVTCLDAIGSSRSALLHKIPLHSFWGSIACTVSYLKGSFLKALSDTNSYILLCRAANRNFALQFLNMWWDWTPLHTNLKAYWNKEEVILTHVSLHVNHFHCRYWSLNHNLVGVVCAYLFLFSCCPSHSLSLSFSQLSPSSSFSAEVRAWRKWKARYRCQCYKLAAFLSVIDKCSSNIRE